MKKILVAIGGVALACVSASSFAQTCAAPLVIQSDSTVTGDTCTATNSLPSYGSTSSPQNEIVYSFVAENANANISLTQNGGFAGTTAGIFLLPSPCTSSTDPIAFGATGSPMGVNGLTNGQTYYVVVTADPGAANNGCGQYTATVTGTLPVALKNFSID